MPDRPNIIFIFTDQWRGDCLSVTGHPAVETPNLDELARGGAVFTSAFSPCPSCIAARASLFTGLTPSSHGRLGYRDQVPWRYDDTMAELLAAAGYETICVGKTHFYPQRLPMGFASMDSYEAMQNFDGKYVNDYDAWLEERTGGRVRAFDHGLQSNSWCARPSHLPEELHNNTWVITRSLERIRERDKSKPFFLFASFHRPHPPIDPPEVFWNMYRDREVPAPPVGDWAGEHDMPVAGVNAWQGRLPDDVLARSRRAYYAQIAHIDCQIGRMFNYLRREEQLGPTWVIFSSDHGEMLGDHHLFRKVYPYQGSAAVPMIICPPKGPLAGEHHGSLFGFQQRTPVTLTDLYPTVLEIAGVPVPKRTEGRSLLPLVGGPDELEGREYVHGEHSGAYSPRMDNQFLTDGRWKYVWHPLDGREQLFDMEEDPGETRDLSVHAGKKEELEKWRARMVAELAPREADGLSDGKRLISGKTLPSVRPELLEGQ
ncbi:MAG: arylsulfatase [Planctomycetota bacterium]|jgi:arylsulfatase A-like enzyme